MEAIFVWTVEHFCFVLFVLYQCRNSTVSNILYLSLT